MKHLRKNNPPSSISTITFEQVTPHSRAWGFSKDLILIGKNDNFVV